MKLHLDTDFGGDMDDLCALALLLRWAQTDIEITGITTTAEANGRRAGYVHRTLQLAGRTGIPVAMGADVSQGYYRYPELGYYDEARYWGEPVAPQPNDPALALDLLQNSIEQGALVVGIGPYTNLALLEQRRPGILRQAQLVLMGGYIHPIRAGFPAWGNEMDWNIQVDVRSAQTVLENAHPLLVPMSVTIETALRRAYLPALRAGDAVAQLIARQAEEFAMDEHNEETWGKTCAGLPDDAINFQHDPLACAIALGWRKGVTIAEVPLLFTIRDSWLHEEIHPAGKPTRVVTTIDAGAFDQFWLKVVAAKSPALQNK